MALYMATICKAVEDRFCAQIKAEDLDFGKDCLELDPLLLDSIHLTADSLGLGSERHHGLSHIPRAQTQRHAIKDEFPG